MTTVPPHYSDRYVNQRYNKALHIVQHLPPSSTFQPTRDQKLEVKRLHNVVVERIYSQQAKQCIYKVICALQTSVIRKRQHPTTGYI